MVARLDGLLRAMPDSGVMPLEQDADARLDEKRARAERRSTRERRPASAARHSAALAALVAEDDGAEAVGGDGARTHGGELVGGLSTDASRFMSMAPHGSGSMPRRREDVVVDPRS